MHTKHPNRLIWADYGFRQPEKLLTHIKKSSLKMTAFLNRVNSRF
ncbi:hypothetical protein [Simonsiella muelleri]|nr:hypothetical protein [Simonsiella muelleri]